MTESQLQQELADARRLVDRYKRSAEIYAIERDRAMARYDITVKILIRIHALLHPPKVTDGRGQTFAFHSPMLDAQVQALSDRIRAIPDEIAEADEAMKSAPDLSSPP